MRKRTQSAIDKAWADVVNLFEKWDAEGYPDEDDETQDPPALSDVQYTDVSQLMKWRQDNSKPT